MKLDIEYISNKKMLTLSYKVLKDVFLVVLLANNLIIEVKSHCIKLSEMVKHYQNMGYNTGMKY